MDTGLLGRDGTQIGNGSVCRRHASIGRPMSPERMRGASAAELAILFPLIMAIVFGIIEFSFLLYDKAMITNAAREGARWGIVLTPASPTCPTLPSTRRSKAAVEAQAVKYCSGKTISIVGSGACQATATQTLAKASCPAFGDTLKVDVRYTYNGTLLLALYKIMAGPIVLTSSATMVYE